MSIVYRKLTSTDFDLWNRIRSTALDAEPTSFARSNEDEEPTRKDVFNGNTDQEDCFILGAFSGDVLVGIAGLFRHKPIKVQHKSMIWSVFVLKEHRGKGIGRELMEQTIEFAKQIEGIELISIGVSAQNSTARGLYNRLGFVEYAIEPRSVKVNGEYCDEALMWMDLTSS
ncbi:MAG: RimJ/RimL family protein N-acetyltransferase [Granulosicoccus sp.]|jgi:RimJ/RimL family protein N-acetyltransferase